MNILTPNAARCDFDILKEVCIFGFGMWDDIPQTMNIDRWTDCCTDG
jgi:hypothetical protein